MSDARADILQRVRTATRGAASSEPIPRAYRRSGTLDAEQRTELFCQRAGEYRATVRRIGTATIAQTVAAVCAELGARTLVVPDALSPAWRPSDVELVVDELLSPRELDALDGTLTGCTAAVAETGTIILTGGPSEGRRAITLVPDLHVCVVLEAQIVELLPDAFALIAAEGLDRRPVTLVSGPSATSDIELSRVEGVHGPRNLIVLVTSD